MAKEDVVAQREGARVQALGERVGFGAAVDADVLEALAEARFHEGADGARQGLAAGGALGRDSRCDAARVGVVRLTRGVALGGGVGLRLLFWLLGAFGAGALRRFHVRRCRWGSRFEVVL